jgi:hypothetical protein
MCKFSTNCKYTVTGCLALLCVSQIHARTLTIRVTDADTKNQIEYAHVAWKPVGAETFKNETATNEKGNAIFTVGNHKQILLMVSCIGYDTFSDTIAVQSGKYNVRLQPSTLNMQEVVVYGKSQDRVRILQPF